MKARKPGCNSSARDAAGIEQRTPARYRQRVGARHRKIAPGEMHFRQRLADAGAMRGVGLARPDAFQKIDDGRGPAGQRAERLAAPVLHRQRAVDAARGEMGHQAEEERQVASGDALFIQRQDERAGRGMQQEIGILDALGDALVGQQFADVVTAKGIPQARRRRRRCKPPWQPTPRRAAANAATERIRSLPRPRPSPLATRNARRTRP